MVKISTVTKGKFQHAILLYILYYTFFFTKTRITHFQQFNTFTWNILVMLQHYSNGYCDSTQTPFPNQYYILSIFQKVKITLNISKGNTFYNCKLTVEHFRTLSYGTEQNNFCQIFYYKVEPHINNILSGFEHPTRTLSSFYYADTSHSISSQEG